MQKATSTSPKISIITINYNASQLTINCVRSIFENCDDQLNFEVIIVDNASEKKDVQSLVLFLETFDRSNLKLIKSRINTGFGGGNMFGVQHSNADYYLFLNNDCLLNENVVHECLQFMEANAEAACCGPKVYGQNGKSDHGFNHFTSIAKELVGKKAVEFVKGPNSPKLRKEYDQPLKVDYVNGSFMFFRASDFDSVGGFDTNIFLYFEESDLCYRLHKNGKSTFYLPHVSYTHLKDQTIGSSMSSPKKLVEFNTSLFYVIRKHHTWLYYKMFHFCFLLRYFIKSFAKPKYFALFIKALPGLQLENSIKQEQKIRGLE